MYMIDFRQYAEMCGVLTQWAREHAAAVHADSYLLHMVSSFPAVYGAGA